MGSELVSTYLRRKFISILDEAEADLGSLSGIIPRFRSIKEKITDSRVSVEHLSVEHLYRLVDALSECRILAHQRHRASKGFFRVVKVVPFSQFMFKIKDIRRRLEEIEENLTTGGRLEGPTSSPRRTAIRQTYPILDASRIIGFESQVKKIEGWLLDNSASNTKEEGLTPIGIVGRCGGGKTALAQKLFASPEIQKAFSPRIWVCLSNMLLDNKPVDTRFRILNYILEEIGCDLRELESPDCTVLEKLQRGLTGKRYLIVLDNAWRVDEWYADLGQRLPTGYPAGKFFSHGLPRGGGGGIIVTSRRESVIRRTVGDEHVIRLEPHLDDNVCWEIFADVVRQQGEIGPDDIRRMSNMKDDIIRNCDGLPLAARTLANIIPKVVHDNPGS